MNKRLIRSRFTHDQKVNKILAYMRKRDNKGVMVDEISKSTKISRSGVVDSLRDPRFVRRGYKQPYLWYMR